MASSRRDNFPQSVITILYKRAGGKCCMCGATTFGAHTGKQDKYQNIGQAAHLAAASPGGPRYDSNMAPEERMSVRNGMWLCSNCHSQIDRDTDAYPLKKLRKIKKEGEERARKEVGVAYIGPGVDRVDDTTDSLQTAVSATTIVEIRKAKASLPLVHGQNIRKDEAHKAIDRISFINFEVDKYFPQVGSEMVSFFEKIATYCTDAEINLEAIRQFHFIVEKFDFHLDQHEIESIANTLYAMTDTFTKRSSVYGSAVALLTGLSRNKQLIARNLHTIPLELLKDIQNGKRKKKRRAEEETDYQEKAVQGGIIADDSSTPEGLIQCHNNIEGGREFMEYIDCMVELAEAGDERVTQLEAKVEDMGYEPNII